MSGKAGDLLQAAAPVDQASMLALEETSLAASHLRVIASPLLPLSPQELGALHAVATLPGVRRIIALPDLHVKPLLETPSSLATALEDRIVLDLSSPSPGCGMALALLPLGVADLTEESMDRFFQFIAGALPLSRKQDEALVEDIRPYLLQGAAAAVERFGLDPAILGRIEGGGNALPDGGNGIDLQASLDQLPAALLALALREFGAIGSGNHFLELQVVDEILDPAVAARWNLRKGQAAVLYHADSGRMGALTGRLFAYRRKNNRRGRLVEMRYKLPFHLRRSGSPAGFFQRLEAFFLPRLHAALPAGGELARQALAALSLARNYATANRLAILGQVGAGLRSVWGEAGDPPELLYDVSHNSIRRETVDGEPLWLHRHNASKALPPRHPDLAGTPYFESGQPVLLPGDTSTVTYLCVARPGVEGSLFSVDHGAGRSAAHLGQTGEAPDTSTRLYGYTGGFSRTVPHRSRAGVDAVLDVLIANDLAAPVARLRPVAVIKDLRRLG